MELSEIIPHIEALIFASDRPLTSLEIVDLINNAFGFMEQQISLDQVDTALDGIREKYSSAYYPFEVLQSGGGWQFLSKSSFHTTIAQLNGGKFLKKLSNAAMETLSIIAYKQPITKGEIESIRGVNSDYSVQKLLEKELVIISGRNEELPGKPLIYETSKNFMDYFGLNSVEDLPKIREVLAEQMVEPRIQERNIESDQDFGIFKKENQPDPPSEQQTEQQTGHQSLQEDAAGDATDLAHPQNEQPASLAEGENNTAELSSPSTDAEQTAADPTEGHETEDSDAEDLNEAEDAELADQELNEAIATDQQEMENELHPDLDHLTHNAEPRAEEEEMAMDDATALNEMDIAEEELADEFNLEQSLKSDQNQDLDQELDANDDEAVEKA